MRTFKSLVLTRFLIITASLFLGCGGSNSPAPQTNRNEVEVLREVEALREKVRALEVDIRTSKARETLLKPYALYEEAKDLYARGKIREAGQTLQKVLKQHSESDAMLIAGPLLKRLQDQPLDVSMGAYLEMTGDELVKAFANTKNWDAWLLTYQHKKARVIGSVCHLYENCLFLQVGDNNRYGYNDNDVLVAELAHPLSLVTRAKMERGFKVIIVGIIDADKDRVSPRHVNLSQAIVLDASTGTVLQ